jgi:hypothetical protein
MSVGAAATGTTLAEGGDPVADAPVRAGRIAVEKPREPPAFGSAG